MALRENYMLDFDPHRLIHAKDLNELSNYETQVFNILQCLQENDLSGLMFWAEELKIEAKEDYDKIFGDETLRKLRVV